MPIAIRAKKTLDMNMMQRQETPPRMDKDLFGNVVLQLILEVWTHSPMIVLELWPPHWGFQEGLKGTGEVDEAVAHEEEHTE